MQKKNQIAYLPYLKYDDKPKITYCGWRILKFEYFLQLHSGTADEKNFLKNLILNNTVRGEIITDPLIIIPPKNKMFIPFSSVDYGIIEEFRRVLFISTISSSNINFNFVQSVATSDNFRIIFQNFIFGENWTAYSSGKLFQITDGGYKHEELKFEKPNYVIRNEVSFDQQLFIELKKIRKINIKIFRRILRAIDAFMQGLCNSDDISQESRILQFTRAFEILFELPMIAPRKEFKEKVKQYCQSDHERLYRYKYERFDFKENKIVKADSKGSMHEMWADRLYTLRNHIIHGDKISTKDFIFKSQHHWYIAMLFFVSSLKQLINEHLDIEIFYDVVKYENKKFEVDDQLQEQIFKQMAESLYKL